MLNEADIDLLRQALSSLKTKGVNEGILEAIFHMGMAKPEDRSEDKFRKIMDKATKGDDILADRITLIEAKLIGMKDSLEIKDVVSNIDK